ncbi:MAG: 50S ribosomal protein L4 [Ilumatobacter sp.]|uniref:50S ribosomal protein L4 n=2 Tax=Bacteria TaxID=2 RepID=UPI003299C8D9
MAQKLSQLTLKDAAGKDAGTIELDADVFGLEPNVPVMHQVVTAQLAARRSGTQSTKTRAEVRGGGKKPWAQKGTGNARQGSIRAPHFTGGGVALGPKPRKYDQKTPKKMVKLATRSALSDRAAEGKVVVVDSWNFDTPKTKSAKQALESLDVGGNVLVVLSQDDTNARLSFRNLPRVQVIGSGDLNAYDILCSDWVVFTKSSLPTGTALGDASGAPAPANRAEADTASAAADHEGPHGKGSHAANDDGSEPEGFPIKGNADSMLFHVPGSRFYKQTIAEVWFATEEAAEAAGFSKPGSQKSEEDQ